MVTTPLEIDTLTIDQLIDSATLTTNALDTLTELDPSRVIGKDKVVAFIQTLADTSRVTSGFPADLLPFVDSLPSYSSADISSILYNAGYSEEDIVNLDFSIEDITKISAAFDQYSIETEGGGRGLLTVLRQVQNVSEVSLSTADLSELANTFTYAVGENIEAILAAGAKTSREFAEDILAAGAAIEENVDALIDELNETAEVTLKDIDTLIETRVSGTIEAMAAETEKLVNSLPEQIAGVVSIAEEGFRDQKISTNNVITAMSTQLSDLSNKMPDVSSQSVTLTTKYIKQDLDRLVSRMDDKNQEFFKAQSATFAAKFRENNSDATEDEVRNSVLRHNSQAIVAFNEETKKKRYCLVEKTRRAEANLTDIRNSSNRNSVESAQGGRPIANRADVISKSKASLEGIVFTAEDFRLSRYKANIAQKLMEIHPDLRKRYANAIGDFLEAMTDKNYDIKITSGYRTLAKQRALYNSLKPRGLPVATPGNSWHNYRVAIDVGLFYKGKYIRNGGIYLNVLSPFFAKYGMHNPIANDRIHFQPTEVPTSPRQIKAKLINTRTQSDDPRAVAAYLDSNDKYFT